MNILIVSGCWTLEPKAGGVQSAVCTLVEELAKDHSVTVFMPRWSQKHLTRDQYGGVTVYRRRLRYPQGGPDFSIPAAVFWLLTLPSTLQDLRQIIKENQISVMHLHQLEHSQLTFAVLRLLGGPPYVATFHGRDVRDYPKRPWLQRLLIRFIARHAAGFTAVSEPLALLAEKTIPRVRNVRLIRNGVQLNEFSASTADGPHTVQPPDRYFLSVGRLYPMTGAPLKGQDLLIRAWEAVSRFHPEVHLLLVGADDERKAYEDLAERCGVRHLVHIVGTIPRSQIAKLMKGALGVITASRSEGGSPTMTILETGSLRRPLIASKIPAHEQALQDGIDCLLVPPEDPASIAQAVWRLMSHPTLSQELGEALYHKVKLHGTADKSAKEYVDKIYRPALLRTR